MFDLAEEWARHGVEWLRLLVEGLGATVIFIGLLVALRGLAAHWLEKRRDDFNPVRLAFARYLAMALEFQLAADILSTAVSPSWDQLGKLAVVAVIRTALNFFLTREIRDERDQPQRKS
ncbi:DUF1622 domain-containing protein [Dechloromonas sp. XY25]|uniref:DUF1622 domain-containing protein n=1 Tax=Dechloromonas hankyongensis TaxID=2908002 RepID=A0ABS9K2R5_9RHOO|nr:DUF1622 domain-containing protein [Dechloromonas hankyongensis]MCG2577474.1 DUF1622 domain-containing protein [Dechloromonas hankyongensis]